MYSSDRARIEAALARCHRALSDVMDSAERESDEHLFEDARMIQVEVTRLAENSLRGKARRQIVGQLAMNTATPRSA